MMLNNSIFYGYDFERFVSKNPVMTINLFTLWLAWPKRSVRKLVFGDEAKKIHARSFKCALRHMYDY